MVQPTPPAELLDAVATADEAVWNGGGTAVITRRHEAARAALAAGWGPGEIAARVRVRPEDVRRWAGS